MFASIFASWPTWPTWTTWTTWTTLSILPAAILCVSALSIRAPQGPYTRGLSASDPYSDAPLGRPRATHPYHDAHASSEIGPALPRDPLELPERADGIRPER